ncbi:MAG: polysaccharide biosynthesis tyrosine autokinase [Planctomycetota bacterium]
MEFKEYLAIIRRRWLLFFPIFVLIVGAHLIWVNYSQHSRYKATSKIILGAEQTNSGSPLEIPVDPLNNVTLSTKYSTLSHMPVLKRAAKLARGDLHFESSEFNEGKFPQLIAESTILVRERFGDGEDGLNAIVEALKDNVAIDTDSDRQIAEVTTESESEQLALMLSWAMVEGAHQFHDEKAREHLDEYLLSLRSKIDSAQNELVQTTSSLNAVKQGVTWENLADRERLIEETIIKYQTRDTELQTEMRTNERFIRNRLNKESWAVRDVELASLATSRSLERIRDQLFQAQLDYETQVTTLDPTHPDMKRITERIRGLEKAFALEQQNLLEESFTQFSKETNELINKNAHLQLQREVNAEQRERLATDLRSIRDLRQEFSPREAAYEDSKQRLAQLRELEKQTQWYADSRSGSVVVYDPALEAEPVVRRGGGVGPLTLTMLMAFIFALGVIYIVEYVDTRVKSEHDIRRHLNLPLLGIIPKEGEHDRLLTDAPLQSEISEKFNTAATLIQSIGTDLNIRAIMVCSAIAREGKTTVSINLAVALARKGFKTVLIDGDLRISQVHNQLRVPNHAGLSQVLDTRVDAQQIIEGVMTDDDLAGKSTSPLSVVQRTSVENLDVIPSGPAVADPVVLLEPARLAAVVSELKQEYDFVIFDTPPINKVGDALTISSAVDGSVFVVGAGQAEQHEVTWAKHLLTNVQSNILGVFLNKFSKQKGGEYYYYYYYNDSKRKRVKSRA